MNIYTRPEFINMAQLAQEYAGPILDWFEEYLGIEYPLPKLGNALVRLMISGFLADCLLYKKLPINCSIFYCFLGSQFCVPFEIFLECCLDHVKNQV